MKDNETIEEIVAPGTTKEYFPASNLLEAALLYIRDTLDKVIKHCRKTPAFRHGGHHGEQN